MKYYFILFLLSISIISVAQSTGRPETSTAVSRPSSFFSKNKQLSANPFFARLAIEPANAEAWWQLYKSVTKMELTPAARKQILAETEFTAASYINNSWQYSLIRFLQSGRRDSAAIHKALSFDEARKQIYPYAIQWALIAANSSLLKQYSASLYQSDPLTPVQYEYHYNALMSAGANATIYAKGITDLVPMLLLQQVLNIRPDLQFRFYDENSNPADGFLCLSLGKDVIKKFPMANYAGLLVNLEATGNPLSKNLEEEFEWKQFDAITLLSETDKVLYQNYLPAMILLYQQYEKKKDGRAITWQRRINKLAGLTGTTALVNQQMQR